MALVYRDVQGPVRMWKVSGTLWDPAICHKGCIGVRISRVFEPSRFQLDLPSYSNRLAAWYD